MPCREDEEGQKLSLPCGRAVNETHGISIRQHAGKKEGGIYFESKKETKKAVELPARPFDGGGNVVHGGEHGNPCMSCT